MSDHRDLQQDIWASQNNEHPLDVPDDELPPRGEEEAND